MQAVTSVEVDGETFDYKTEPRCRVCSSSDRLEIERSLLKGMTYERIAETFSESDGINARGVRAHVSRGHIPINAPAVKALERARSEEVGAVIAPLAQGVAAHLTFAHAVVDRVRARLASGDVEPNVRDALAAARLIVECEAALGPATEEQWLTEYHFIFENMKEVMTADQFEVMVTRLRAHSREIEASRRLQ